MQTLWGTGTNGHEGKPNWLTADEADRCYATAGGWMLRHPDGTEELLVAVRGLSLTGKLAGASIDKITWATGAFGTSAAKTLKVRFNEKVAVTGNPTLAITNSLGGTITATYASINSDNNILTFNFTTPASAATLSIAAQSVLLAGGTINELDTTHQSTTAASLAISSAVATAAGTKAVA
jgi:hypothetical protein